MKIHVQTPEVYDYLRFKFNTMQSMITALKNKLDYTEKTVQPPELIKRYTEPLRATVIDLENIIINLKIDMLSESILEREEREMNEALLEYQFGIKPPHKRNDN